MCLSVTVADKTPLSTTQDCISSSAHAGITENRYKDGLAGASIAKGPIRSSPGSTHLVAHIAIAHSWTDQGITPTRPTTPHPKERCR